MAFHMICKIAIPDKKGQILVSIIRQRARKSFASDVSIESEL